VVAVTTAGSTFNMTNKNNNAQYNYLIQLPYNLQFTLGTSTVFCRMFFYLNQSTLTITASTQNISWSYFTTTGTPPVAESSAITPLVINCAAITIQQFIFNLTCNNIPAQGFAFGVIQTTTSVSLNNNTFNVSTNYTTATGNQALFYQIISTPTTLTQTLVLVAIGPSTMAGIIVTQLQTCTLTITNINITGNIRATPPSGIIVNLATSANVILTTATLNLTYNGNYYVPQP
jgi:hypothetical protein